MVTIGQLRWKVQVEEAAEAKEKAEEVKEQVRGVKEEVEETDESTENYSERLGVLEDVLSAANTAFDRMAVKAGFLGTAIILLKNGLVSLVGWLLKTTGIATAVGAGFSKLTGILVGISLSGILGPVVGGIKALLGYLSGLSLSGILGSVKAGIMEVIGALRGLTMRGALRGVLTGLSRLVSFLGGPITVAVAAFVTAFIANFGGLRDFVMDIVSGILGAFADFIGGIYNLLTTLFGGIVDVAARHLGPLVTEFVETFTLVAEVTMAVLMPVLDFLDYIVGGMLDIVSTTLAPIVETFNWTFGRIYDVVHTVFEAVGKTIEIGLDAIMTTIRVILAIIRMDWAEAWELLVGFVERTFGAVVDFVAGAINGILGAFQDIIDVFWWFYDSALAVVGIVEDIFGFLVDLGGAVYEFTVSILGGALDVVTGIWDTATDIGDAVWTATINFVNDPLGTVTDLLANLGELADKTFNAVVDIVMSIIPDIGVSEEEWQQFREQAPNMAQGMEQIFGGAPGAASGGVVEKTGIAEIHKGEAVIPERLVQAAERGSGRREPRSESKTVNVNIEGVEVGDQSLDIRNMSRAELRQLAQEISNILGDDIREMID